MSTVFATTPEARAAEVAQVAANLVSYAESIDIELDLLDHALRREATLFLARITHHDPAGATHTSKVQHQHDVAFHLATDRRALDRCVTRLTRAGVR